MPAVKLQALILEIIRALAVLQMTFLYPFMDNRAVYAKLLSHNHFVNIIIFIYKFFYLREELLFDAFLAGVIR